MALSDSHSLFDSMMVGALACAVIYVWAFEVGRESPEFPSLPPTSLNAVVLALSFITLFLWRQRPVRSSPSASTCAARLSAFASEEAAGSDAFLSESNQS